MDKESLLAELLLADMRLDADSSDFEHFCFDLSLDVPDFWAIFVL
jgi:hypothetical protein